MSEKRESEISFLEKEKQKYFEIHIENFKKRKNLGNFKEMRLILGTVVFKMSQSITLWSTLHHWIGRTRKLLLSCEIRRILIFFKSKIIVGFQRFIMFGQVFNSLPFHQIQFNCMVVLYKCLCNCYWTHHQKCVQDVATC